jgi:hypothetical protein
MLEGSVPIVVGGQVVGAIGVSGVKSSEDAQIAKAGIDAPRSAGVAGAHAGTRPVECSGWRAARVGLRAGRATCPSTRPSHLLPGERGKQASTCREALHTFR